jgi:hypothetical protein
LDRSASGLAEECFSLTDSTGTTLRTGLLLDRLNGLGIDDFHPLIIKSKNDMDVDYGIGTLYKLGDQKFMYDIFDLLSTRLTSTPSHHTCPSDHISERNGGITKMEELAPPLSDSEKEAISNHDNLLWKKSFDGAKKSVSIGSTEATVDSYVSLIIESVADALKLNLRLEQQSYINSKKADHWVISFEENNRQGWIVGCNENKLPQNNYGNPYVTENNKFLVQIYDQMMEVYNYYGTVPVLGIGSTGREWRFFRLPSTKSPSQEDISVLPRRKEKSDDYSPISGNVGLIQYDDDDDDDDKDAEQEDGVIKEEEKMQLFASNVYRWDDKEMLFMLGSVLKQMALSKRTLISTTTDQSINHRVMWHLIKTDSVLPWGWANLSVSKLHWRSMISEQTDKVVVLGLLGKGADGKVLLVANKMGQVSAMKIIKTAEGDNEDYAEKEANIWNAVYTEYCVKYKWAIRSEKWMGLPAVIMPVLSQFATKSERLDNLDGVKDCLVLFHERGYRHDDIYLRNIGYFKPNGKIIVVMLDLHPGHVFVHNDSSKSWIETALKNLERRANTIHE